MRVSEEALNKILIMLHEVKWDLSMRAQDVKKLIESGPAWNDRQKIHLARELEPVIEALKTADTSLTEAYTMVSKFRYALEAYLTTGMYLDSVITGGAKTGQQFRLTGDPVKLGANLVYNQTWENCALVSFGNVLQMGGTTFDQATVRQAALNHKPPLCDADGGISPNLNIYNDLASALGANVTFNVSAPGQATEIASHLAAGRGVIISVDCGVLWNDPSYYTGSANHAVTVTSAIYDRQTNDLVGFMICDSGRQLASDATRCISLAEFESMHILTANCRCAYTNEVVRSDI